MAAALVAALGYLMMLVFILHLAILLCTTVKVKNYYALLNTQYPSNTLCFLYTEISSYCCFAHPTGDRAIIELIRVSYSAMV